MHCFSLDAQQKKERVGSGDSRAITLEAIYNTTCSKCHVKGHLAKNCFGDGTSYELIPEPEPEKKIFGSIQDRLQRLASAGVPAQVPPTTPTEPKIEKHKRKRTVSSSSSEDEKVRKRKKANKRKSRGSSSPERKRKKSKKKHKKNKKHKKEK